MGFETKMKFYVGISHIKNIQFVPRFFILSINRLLKRKSKINPLGKEWILDSGGYSQLSLYGKYTFTIDDYLKIVNFQQPNFFVNMDWMCEPQVRKKTGKDIKYHLNKTIENHIKIKEKYNGDSIFMGVIQGYEKQDYLLCIDLLKSYGLVEKYMGIGTLCRRQRTKKAIEIISSIKSEIPAWVKLHGFGIKTGALRYRKIFDLLYSVDSHAWSFEARTKGYRIIDQYGNCKLDGKKCLNKNKNCANCGRYMRYWTFKIEKLIKKQESQYSLINFF